MTQSKKMNLEDKLLEEIRYSLSGNTSQDEIYITLSNELLKEKAIKAEIENISHMEVSQLCQKLAEITLVNKLLLADNTSMQRKLDLIELKIKTYINTRSLPRVIGGKERHKVTAEYKEIAFTKYCELTNNGLKSCYYKTLWKALESDDRLLGREIPWNEHTLKTWCTEFKKRLLKEASASS